MTKVLVTGGQGFLGSHIVTGLLNEGKEVRILARPGKDSSHELSKDVNIFYGDIRDTEAVEAAVNGVDIVIHVVSNFRKGGSDNQEAYSVNVLGTENVLHAAKKYNVRHLIHCSTIGVHGTVLEIPANESTPFNPTDLYQETKLIAEKKVWKFHQDNDLPITVIRPISLFGPDDQRMLKLFRMINKGRFFIVGDGEVLFHPTYIDDAVKGFLTCIENPKAYGQAFIIGGEQYVTLNQLCQIIADELNVKPPSLKLPMAPILALATICEKACEPFGIEPPLHRRRVSFFQNNRAFSIAKAKDILQFEPQYSIKDCIHATLNGYVSRGWI